MCQGNLLKNPWSGEDCERKIISLTCRNREDLNVQKCKIVLAYREPRIKKK
jgi:hypothetical protein